MQQIFPYQADGRHRQVIQRTGKPGQAIKAFFFSAIQQPGRAKRLQATLLVGMKSG